MSLKQDQDVLWKLTRAVYGIKPSLKQWQQFLASKLEELGLRKNKTDDLTDPCIFVSEQLIVMIHLGTVLTVGDKHRQESFIDQLSASISLKNKILNKTLEYSKQDHSISLHLSSSIYMKLFKMYGLEQQLPQAQQEISLVKRVQGFRTRPWSQQDKSFSEQQLVSFSWLRQSDQTSALLSKTKQKLESTNSHTGKAAQTSA